MNRKLTWYPAHFPWLCIAIPTPQSSTRSTSPLQTRDIIPALWLASTVVPKCHADKDDILKEFLRHWGCFAASGDYRAWSHIKCWTDFSLIHKGFSETLNLSSVQSSQGKFPKWESILSFLKLVSLQWKMLLLFLPTLPIAPGLEQFLSSFPRCESHVAHVQQIQQFLKRLDLLHMQGADGLHTASKCAALKMPRT